METKLTFEDLTIDEFDQAACDAFLAGLSDELEVPLESIRILSVEAGSVILTLELIGSRDKPAVSLLMQVQCNRVPAAAAETAPVAT